MKVEGVRLNKVCLISEEEEYLHSPSSLSFMVTKEDQLPHSYSHSLKVETGK